jgi:hypothetical protein
MRVFVVYFSGLEFKLTLLCRRSYVQNTNNTFCIFFFYLHSSQSMWNLWRTPTHWCRFLFPACSCQWSFDTHPSPTLTCDVLAVCFIIDLTPHGPRADCDPHFCFVVWKLNGLIQLIKILFPQQDWVIYILRSLVYELTVPSGRWLLEDKVLMWLMKPLVKICLFWINWSLRRISYAHDYRTPPYTYVRKFLELAVVMQSTDTYLDRCEKFRSAM